MDLEYSLVCFRTAFLLSVALFSAFIILLTFLILSSEIDSWETSSFREDDAMIVRASSAREVNSLISDMENGKGGHHTFSNSPC